MASKLDAIDAPLESQFYEGGALGSADPYTSRPEETGRTPPGVACPVCQSQSISRSTLLARNWSSGMAKEKGEKVQYAGSV